MSSSQFNPLLWQNVNLDDPRQIREFMRQLVPYLAWLQQRLIVLLNAPPPTGGGTVSASWGEVPGGAVNSSNLAFTTAVPYQAGMLSVYLNGVRQKKPGDYSETSSTGFSFVIAPTAGDIVTVDYFKA